MMGRFPAQWAKKKCHFRGCLAGLVVNQLEVLGYVGIQKSQRSIQRPIKGRKCDFLELNKTSKGFEQ